MNMLKVLFRLLCVVVFIIAFEVITASPTIATYQNVVIDKKAEKKITEISNIDLYTKKFENVFYQYDRKYIKEIVSFVVKKSAENGIDANLVFAIMWKESSFNSTAFNKTANDYGLMQINYEVWADELEMDLIYDIEYNINFGINFIKKLSDEYDLRKVSGSLRKFKVSSKEEFIIKRYYGYNKSSKKRNNYYSKVKKLKYEITRSV